MQVSLRYWAVAMTAVTTLLGAADTAHAAGIEDTVTGTHALGRGAYYARVRDFMAVWQNPANLAIMPDSNLGLNLRVPIFNGCFTRKKDPSLTYFDDTEDGQPPFDEVCNNAGILPTGSGGFAFKLSDSLGIGGGMFVPAGVGKLAYGNDTVYTKSPVDPNDPSQQLQTTAPGDDVPATSPARFNLLSRETIAAYFMAGVGWAPHKMVRVGLSAGFSFAAIHFQNVAALQPGDESTEFLTDVKMVDGFIPRLTTSVGVTPIPGLDISTVFTFNDDIRARGDVEMTANGFQGADLGDCRDERVEGGDGLEGPGPRCKISNARLVVPYQRFQLMFAGRYGLVRAGKTESVDPFEDEVFDVETDIYWEQTSHVRSYDLTLSTADDAVRPSINANTAAMGVNSINLPPDASIAHNWNNTWGLRVGGDYNVLPGLFAVRAGVGYESQGVPAQYMGLDFWPVQKVVMHLGATVRVGPVDLHVAYAHSFNWNVTTKVGTGGVRQVVAVDRDEAWAINEGKYTSKLDVVALGATYNL